MFFTSSVGITLIKYDMQKISFGVVLAVYESCCREKAWLIVIQRLSFKVADSLDIRPSLIRTKLEFKKQSYVFWVLFMYKIEGKKLEIPEMGGSAGPGGVWTPLGPL